MTAPVLPEHWFRHEHGRVVAILARRFRTQPIALCEDAAQGALLRALETWPRTGIPHEPGAWVYRVAHRQVVDAIRAARRVLPESESASEPDDDGVRLASELPDDLLRMLFLCADPEIPYESQIALALKTLCGFSTEEIALRFFQSVDAIHKRLQRARAVLRERGDLDIPSARELEERLMCILHMIYLLFNEGYSSAKVDSILRRELCDEAVRLAEILAAHPVGDVPEAEALLALMCFHRARFEARFDGVGGMLLLHEQDRSRWDHDLIGRGVIHLGRAAQGERFSRYHVEAAIAAAHCLAPTYAATPWEEIARLYVALDRVAPSPLNQLHRAIAIAEHRGAKAGLDALAAADPPPWLLDYYLWDATWGELHRRAGDLDRAVTHLRRALESVPTDAERAVLERRLLECVTVGGV